ncbi:integrin alpha-L-like [Archocentrus centrarchus]|uniref:integrin alpha-L-like n=1 Tax=Archocentrus centrarchus TaxID=63155 RepID=UPI0011EA01AB|nr:integrin alpha-L-like [Archocentrus centrarchus]
MIDYHQQMLKEMTTNTVDLVFLFDGSASMTEAEFNKNKDFIVEIMDSLKNTSIKFAAVQFSRTVNKVFDFNDYEAGSALEKLKNEKHLKSLTNTHRALEFVMNEILENPAAGATPDATKVLVLITDGDPSDVDRTGIIKKYDDKNIIRLVIGIGDAKLDKFRAIASEPKDKNAFKIENYDGLTEVLENFQKKIFVIEGSKVARAGDMTDEMSQSGFSAVFNKVCGPRVVSKSSDSSYLNTVCHKITSLQQSSSFPPAAEEHTNNSVDLVFLFDGSASMTQAEFNKNKDFIVEIMDSLKNTSIKFAAVQFSRTVNKVFDFNDYEAGSALEKLKDEKHLRSHTNTHKALEFVMNEILENPAAGATPDATKVLVLITDGDPSDVDRTGIIKKYDDKNIIRLVIGIKDAKLDKFRAIASEPKDKNAFKIENYDGLTEVLQNVNKASDLEVCRSTRVRDTTDESSQSGFSAVFRKDTLIVGSVGSNSWRSSLHKHREEMQVDSYLGNSISVGEKNGVPLYFNGAPVFEHTGQIVLFRHQCKYWTAVQRISGDQIGSYFGAELHSFDVDSDGNTDFLLVGAPLFHLPLEMKEGRIYIYSLTEKMLLERNQDVTAPSTGRFGTTISSLADLNGDGLRDVAVGAPLEDGNSGVVYIYHGHRQRGITSTFSQRIVGININSELRFFGKAIVGDLGEDGLPSVVVGSHDAAVVLRSKPVFNVLPRLSFDPEERSTETLDCLSPDTNVPLVSITVCFEMVEATKRKAGAVSSALNIKYMLRVTSQTSQKSFIQTLELRDESTCFNYPINITNFVEDTSSPLRIRLNFFQPDSESATAVLNVDADREAVLEVPFKNKC